MNGGGPTRVVAGIDIGNSTTEIVLARTGPNGTTPLWHGRVNTRGEKGSRSSVEEAAALLRRGEEHTGACAVEVLMAEVRPVHTLTATFDDTPEVGPVRSLAHGTATPAGRGTAVGTHVPLAALASGGRPTGGIVVSIDSTWDFDEAATLLRQAVLDGVDLRGVLVEEDEAVLISNRIPIDVPVVDEVDVAALAPGATIALEVVALGEVAHRLTDPLAVASALGLDSHELRAAAASLRELGDRRALALARAGAVSSPSPADPTSSAGWVAARLGGRVERLSLERARRPMGSWPPGTVEHLAITSLAGGDVGRAVADAWLVSLDDVDDASWLRRDTAELHAALIASLAADSCAGVSETMSELTGRPVTTLGSEASAARAGALTTPSSPADAIVCDIGGGTVDCLSTSGAVVAAGGGELLTGAVAAALGISTGLAERVKRTPAIRPDGPHLAHEEDGRRSFLEAPAAPHVIGRLSVRSDGGDLVPFSDRLAPEEWRGLRLALKRATVGACVTRALAALPQPLRASHTVVLAGGGALDDELVGAVAESLRTSDGGPVVARADVAGLFGPRCAVAWGLVVLAGSAGTTDRPSRQETP